MTQQEKQLLLQDLCIRLPYGVIVEYGCKHEGKDLGERKSKLTGRMIDSFFGNMTIGMSEVYSLQPYLRQLPCMEKSEIADAIKHIFNTDEVVYTTGAEGTGFYAVLKNKMRIKVDTLKIKLGEYGINNIDWLNEHHFDYRSLIEKGLALPAPDGMYKTN